MISPEDRTVIIELAKAYRAKRVLLFGSASAPTGNEARDIDLGVEGVSNSIYFRFYGDLIMSLSKPVDLVDLDSAGLFGKLARRDGVTLYVES